MNYRNYYIYSILVFILLFSNSNNLFSQTVAYKNYNVTDGLPSSEVYHTIQDSKGYIWFATNQGVSRFNGYEFENFSMADGLPDNTVFDLFEDYKGRIWFLPISLQLSYFFEDSIYTYMYNDTIKQYVSKNISPPFKKSFYVDSSDYIYISQIGSSEKEFIVTADGKAINLVDNPNYNHGFIKVENHAVFYKGNSGSKTFNYNSEEQIAIHNEGFFSYGFGVYENDGKVIYSVGNTLHIIDASKHVRTIMSPERIYWISRIENEYWIGTTDGIYISDTLFENAFERKILDKISVSSIHSDLESNIWITSLNKGVFQIKNKKIKIFDETHNLIYRGLNKLLIKDQTLLISYLHPGLSYMNLNYPSIIRTIDKNIKQIHTLYTRPHSPDIYLSNWDGIFKTDKTVNQINNLHISKQNVNNGTKNTPLHSCKSLLSFNDTLWIAGATNFLKSKNGFYSTVCKERAYDIHLHNNVIYLGTLTGLASYTSNKFEYLGTKDPLLQGRINDIETLNDRYLILATKGTGLILYNTIDKSTMQLTFKDGIAGNAINKITVSGDSLIWIATNNGISRINTICKENSEIEFGSIYNISDYNGLPSREINDIVCFQNNVFLSTANGLVSIDISEIKRNVVSPPVYIKLIKLGQEKLPKKQKYTLKNQATLLSIEYVGLAYKKTGQLEYRYRMIGLDTAWNNTKERIIQYASLSPGSYTFEVTAQNEDGIWSTEPARVEFEITPPIYKTIWFILLCLAVIITVAFMIIRYREREIRKKNLLLLTINNYKQQILRQQMNPHFMFNTLNSIQYYLLEEDIDSSLDYLSQFARLMRMILENSQKKYIPIKTELDALELYLNLEILRYEQKINYEINISKEINTLEYKIPPLLLQPYCENAIKHGLANKDDDGKITISIYQDDGKIICSIEDNGIGRLKAKILNQDNSTGKGHKSLGTEISANRVKILNELYSDDIKIGVVDLQDDEGMPTGTRIEIVLPIITNHEL